MADPLRNPDISEELAENAMRDVKNYRPASEDFAAEAREPRSSTWRALRLAYDRTAHHAAESCGYLAENSSRLSSRAREELRLIVRERPLQLLAVIGAVAFAAGIAVRIWRSKSS